MVFYQAFAADSIARDFEKLTRDLGSHWELSGLAFKPYACGTMVQPFIDAALALREQIGDVSTIARIDAPTSEAIVHRLWEPLQEKRHPSTAYSAKFSVPYGISVALIDGKAGLEQFTQDRISDKILLALSEKVHYVVDVDDPYPDNYVGALTVTLNNSQQYSATQPFMRGGRHAPLSRVEIIEKFRANTIYGGWNGEQTAKLPRVLRESVQLSVAAGDWSVSLLTR